SNTASQAEQKPELNIAWDIGRDGAGRNSGDINHADIAGAETGAHPSFLESLQQILIKLTVRFGIALEHGIFDRAFVELIGLLLLLVEGSDEEVLALQRGQIFI